MRAFTGCKAAAVVGNTTARDELVLAVEAADAPVEAVAKFAFETQFFGERLGRALAGAREDRQRLLTQHDGRRRCPHDVEDIALAVIGTQGVVRCVVILSIVDGGLAGQRHPAEVVFEIERSQGDFACESQRIGIGCEIVADG